MSPTYRASCGCVWERTDPDTYDGECAVGDTCECDDPDHHPSDCGRLNRTSMAKRTGRG
jgi:hypothetical protein